MKVKMHTREGRKARVCSRDSRSWVFVLRVLIYFLKAGILGGILGENLNRILISFILMCQNEIYSLLHPSLGVAGT